jgi:predicted lipoprotein with Yx(FWY)xxD motif
VALAAAVLVLTAACGGGSGSGTAGTSSTGSGAASVLRPEDGPLGRILVDRRGRTVYVFAKDAAGTSSCTGACATN